jgi:hypothetical protein
LVDGLSSTAAACTIFSASNNETTLVGNNEDWEHNNFSIIFYPENFLGYGHVAFVATEDYLDVRAGMNTQGVFIDSASVRPSNVTIDPEKVFINHNFFKRVLWTCSSVNETIEMFQHFNIAETWNWQVFVADSYGDSVVIAAGPDETVWYVRGNGTYQLCTNGNIAYPELGQSDWSALRYDQAESMLEEFGDNITVVNARDVLDAVHSVWTGFSSVYDLVNRDIYIYFNHDYSKEIVFNLDEELALGGHSFEIVELYQSITIPSTTTTVSITSNMITTTLDSNLLLTLSMSFSIVISAIVIVLFFMKQRKLRMQ